MMITKIKLHNIFTCYLLYGDSSELNQSEKDAIDKIVKGLLKHHDRAACMAAERIDDSYSFFVFYLGEPRAIKTKCSSRYVKASYGKESLSLSLNNSVDKVENHRRAAATLAVSLKLSGEMIGARYRNGYIWTFTDVTSRFRIMEKGIE